MYSILFLLLLSIVDTYSMKRDRADNRQTSEIRDAEQVYVTNDEQEEIKRRRVGESSYNRTVPVQDVVIYEAAFSQDLVRAVEIGNESSVAKLLQAGADPNSTTSEDKSCLAIAAERGYKDIIKMLLGIGASLNAQDNYGGTALTYAVTEDRKEVVKILLEHKANQHITYRANDITGITPLILASVKGHKEIVEMLTAYGAHVNAQDSIGRTALMAAAKHGYKKIVELLIAKDADVNTQDSSGVTALVLAVFKGHKEIVKILLDKGADAAITYKDSQGVTGVTLLMWAALDGHKEIVEMLIARGAHVNAQDKSGDTALMNAAEKGHKEIVELLIAKGANVNTQNSSGNTALVLAILKGHKEVVKVLLDKGADTTITYKGFQEGVTGVTPLMWAALDGHKEIVEMLIARGAHVNAQDSTGRTALMYAATKSHQEIICLLIKHKAEVQEVILERVPLNNAVRFLLESYLHNTNLRAYSACPQEYAQYHREQLLERQKFGRDCKVSTNALLYLLHSRQDHNACTHQTVLMWAGIFGHKEAIEELLKADLPLWYLNAQDNHGRTALMYAIIYGHYDIVQLLAQAYERKVKAVYEALEKETDPIKRNHLQQELKKIKSVLNIASNEGKSALAYALEKKDSMIALRLIAAGARPSISEIKTIAHQTRKDLLLELIVKGFINPHGK